MVAVPTRVTEPGAGRFTFAVSKSASLSQATLCRLQPLMRSVPRGGSHNAPMVLRFLRFAIVWLALAALTLQGFAATGAVRPQHAPMLMKQVPSASPGMAADRTAGGQMAASTATPAEQQSSDCGGCMAIRRYGDTAMTLVAF